MLRVTSIDNKLLLKYPWRRSTLLKSLRVVVGNLLAKQQAGRILICSSGTRKTRVVERLLQTALLEEGINTISIEKNPGISLDIARILLQERADRLLYIDSPRLKGEEDILINSYQREGSQGNPSKLTKAEVISWREVVGDVSRCYREGHPVKDVSILIRGRENLNSSCIRELLTRQGAKVFVGGGGLLSKWSLSMRSLGRLGREERGIDLILNLSKSGNKLTLAAKHRGRYTQISQEMLYPILLDSLRREMGDLGGYYAVFNPVRYPLLAKLAKHYNLTSLSRLGEGGGGKELLFKIDDERGFVLGGGEGGNLWLLSYLLRIANRYKEEGGSFYLTYKRLSEEGGNYNTIERSLTTDDAAAGSLINSIDRYDNVAGSKVVRVKRYSEGEGKRCAEVDLSSGCKAYLEFNKVTSTLSFALAKEAGGEGELLEFVEEDRDFSEYINNLKRGYKGRVFDLKLVRRYLSFLLLVVLINVYLFSYFFKINDSAVGIFTKSWEEVNKPTAYPYLVRGSLLLVLLSSFINSAFNAIFIKRITKLQGERISLWHILIGVLVGVCFSNITPFPIGGEFANYWYWRRKGVGKSTIIIAISLGMLSWNVLVLILFAILIPLLALNGSAVTSDSFLLSYIVMSSSLNLVWFLIIFIPFKFRGIQNLIVRFIDRLFEWIPLLGGKHKYYTTNKIYLFLHETRRGLEVLYKHPMIFVEGIIWKFLASSLPYAALFAALNFSGEGVSFISIWERSLMHRLLNTISFTPGGSGISEILFRRLMWGEFKGGDTLKTFNFVTNTLSGYLIPTTASMLTFIVVVLRGRGRGRHVPLTTPPPRASDPN